MDQDDRQRLVKEFERVDIESWRIVEHYGHLLTDDEGAALDALIAPLKGGDESRIRQSVASKKLIDVGLVALCDKIKKRVLSEEREGRVFLNRCPRCNALARTPRARQCPKCIHRW